MRRKPVVCPACKQRRYVSSEYHRAKTRKNNCDWTCAECAKLIKRVEQSRLSALKRAEANRINELEVPCGVIHRTRLSDRCKPYDECEHYWECLCKVADLDWRGWNENA